MGFKMFVLFIILGVLKFMGVVNRSGFRSGGFESGGG